MKLIIRETNFDADYDDDKPIYSRFLKTSSKVSPTPTESLKLFSKKKKKFNESMTTSLTNAFMANTLKGERRVIVEAVAEQFIEGKKDALYHIDITTMDIPDSPRSDTRHMNIPWEVLHAADLELQADQKRMEVARAKVDVVITDPFLGPSIQELTPQSGVAALIVQAPQEPSTSDIYQDDKCVSASNPEEPSFTNKVHDEAAEEVQTTQESTTSDNA